MRFQRVKMSCTVLPSACPMCSEPVTFGGGMTIENGALGAAASAWKYRRAVHSSYQRFSRVEGS
jgi:hypothetical protein